MCPVHWVFSIWLYSNGKLYYISKYAEQITLFLTAVCKRGFFRGTAVHVIFVAHWLKT